MDRSVLIVSLIMLAVPLAGCLGGGDWDFEPGTDYKPTGKTVHLRMWVEDMVQSDIYPGLQANLWAFCAEPADPNDEYSAAAIEYREPQGVVGRLDSSSNLIVDEEATQKCSVPGPQLRVQQGDKVIVDFQNDHFHPHSIHWHGQFVPWESDGVPGSTQDAVQPQTGFRYEFEAKRAGTLWYHCHVDTQFHVMQGLFGVIIVEPQNKEFEPKVDRDYTLVFSNMIRSNVEPDPDQTDPHANHKHGLQCGVTGVSGCKNPHIEGEPDVFMINGVSAPNTFFRNDTVLKINPDEKIRVRLLNAGPFTIETFHTHGHDMLVTHVDGNPINPEARYWVDTIMIGPGQRYDVVIEGREGNEGVWVAHTHITSRVTNSGQYPGGMLTKIVYEDWAEEQGIDAPYKPFDGVETAGGLPFVKKYSIPDDLFLGNQYTPGVDPAGSDLAVMTVPVELPCAVKRLIVQVEADGVLPALLGDVAVELTAPNGDILRSGTLDDNGELELVLTDEAPVVGDPTKFVYHIAQEDGAKDLTVTVSGSNLDAEIDIDVIVDYYRTKETAQYYADKVAGRPMCEELMNPGIVGFYAPTFPPTE